MGHKSRYGVPVGTFKVINVFNPISTMGPLLSHTFNRRHFWATDLKRDSENINSQSHMKVGHNVRKIYYLQDSAANFVFGQLYFLF